MYMLIEHVVLLIQLHVNRTCGITYTATCKYNMWYYLYNMFIEHVVLLIQLHVNRTCGITYTAKYNMW